jgi:hypothetical protein
VGRRTLALLSLSSALVACQLLLGIEDDRFHVADAGAGESGIPDPCQHAAPPPRPDAADGINLPVMLFALETVDVSGRNASGEIAGYDLDGVCACDHRPGAAHGGQPSCKRAASSDDSGCEGDGGVDSLLAYNSLYPLVAPLLKDSLESNAACGRQTMLIQLSDYNGFANDPDVSVAIAPSFGLVQRHPEGEDFDAAAECYPTGVSFPEAFADATVPAKRDGTDRWSILPRYGTEVLTSAYRGWVTDSILSVRLDSPDQPAAFDVVLGSRLVGTGSAILTGHLTPVDRAPGTFRLEHAILTGRMKLDDFLSTVGTLITSPGQYFCASQLYPAAKAVVCSSADMLIPAVRDFRGDTCNAAAFVVQFNAGPARLGGNDQPATHPPMPGCGQSFNDTCGDL